MKAIKNILTSLALAAVLVATPSTSMHAQQGPPPPYPGYGSEPWSVPPQELQGVERKGFHDGIEGARRDYENHRPPSVENRDEYRHPSVPHHDREAYRAAFRRGYQVGVEHLMHGLAGRP
ncbi:MAG TPA: hypothetical protein VGG18_07470 [Granulicella sp.]